MFLYQAWRWALPKHLCHSAVRAQGRDAAARLTRSLKAQKLREGVEESAQASALGGFWLGRTGYGWVGRVVVAALVLGRGLTAGCEQRGERVGRTERWPEC